MLEFPQGAEIPTKLPRFLPLELGYWILSQTFCGSILGFKWLQKLVVSSKAWSVTYKDIERRPHTIPCVLIAQSRSEMDDREETIEAIQTPKENSACDACEDIRHYR